MITGGREQARDEVFTLVRDVIINEGYTDSGIIWQDDLKDLDVDDVLFLVHMQHVDGRQASLAGDGPKRRREVRGMVHVTIRAAVRKGGLTIADNMSTIMETAFFGKTTPNGVWFREVIGREVPAKDGNVQTEVSAEFVYQELT